MRAGASGHLITNTTLHLKKGFEYAQAETDCAITVYLSGDAVQGGISRRRKVFGFGGNTYMRFRFVCFYADLKRGFYDIGTFVSYIIKSLRQDALDVLRFVVKLAEPTQRQMETGDVNISGALEAEDALLILQYVVKIIDAL